MGLPRSVKPSIWIQGQDVTSEISPFLRSVIFTDSISGQADELSFSVHNRDGRFAGKWEPAQGSEMSIKLEVNSPWLTKQKETYLGDFSVDKISHSGFPFVTTIAGISAPMKTDLRRTKKSFAYQGLTLKEIAKMIARRAKLDLMFDASEGMAYSRRDQKGQSDLGFLRKLCEEQGLELKVTTGLLVIFDRRRYEKKKPIGTLDLSDPSSSVLGFSFEAFRGEEYSTAECRFFDFKKNKMLSSTAEDPTYTGGPKLVITRRVDSIAEAKAAAEKALWSSKVGATTMRVSALGDPGLMPPQCLYVKGLRNHEGKWIVAKAAHNLVDSGWCVSLTLNRIVES